MERRERRALLERRARERRWRVVSTVSLNRDDGAAEARERHWRSEHRLIKPGRHGRSGGYRVDAAEEYREHRLVKPGRYNWRGG
ncbi:hypothetical protein K440DRAFT_286356 [Wilcoxina mikolae CBS 423.85]|nr:hypothetical protein K440DRAFT_286356 [Wilcoxina mikolae CBS 423.85]